ncbi:hypothetical protein [Flexivirga lutea]
MVSSTASTHAVSHARAAAFVHGTSFSLPTYPKLEVTERPARTLGEPRLPENST